MKHLMDLDQCIHEAIEYDDNCDTRIVGTNSQTHESIVRVSSQVDKIIRGVTKKMQQLYGPPTITDRHIDWPYICGICGKNHPISQCIPKNQVGTRLEPQLDLQCDSTRDGEIIQLRIASIVFNTCKSKLKGMPLKFIWMETRPFQCWIGNLHSQIGQATSTPKNRTNTFCKPRQSLQ